MILVTSKYLGLLNFLKTAFSEDVTIDLDRLSNTWMQVLRCSSLKPVNFSNFTISDDGLIDALCFLWANDSAAAAYSDGMNLDILESRSPSSRKYCAKQKVTESLLAILEYLSRNRY